MGNEKLENILRLTIGDIEIISLTDAMATMPAKEMFPTVSHAQWVDYHEMYPTAFDDENIWKLRIGCTFVKTAEHLIAVDTGVGPSNTAFAKFLQADGKLPARMKEAGIAAEDVDMVLLTHLHGDHVGWNTHLEIGDPFFSNARYFASALDWEFCQDRLKREPGKAAYIQENILPLLDQKRLNFVDSNFQLSEGVSTFPTPGHTPGQLGVNIEATNAEKVWLLGDVVAHPLQITEPSHPYIFDNNQDLAIATRHEILERIEAEGGILGACHLPFPGFGRLTLRSGKRFWSSI